MASMQPLREEHAELLPHIEALRTAGDAVGAVDVSDLRSRVDAAYEFLSGHLLPHAEAEEAALYPAVQNAVGAPEATATMTRDHVEVHALTVMLDELRTRLATVEAVDGELASGLREVLYGLYHLVKVHFAKEEEVYLPILEERLTPEEADEMFAAMHEAAHHTH
jgi:hemerythrin-like domain-containing protein